MIWISLAASVGFAATDFDGDGYDDVWQRLHGVSVATFPLNDDNDGDGRTNREESIAGTNPKDASDRLGVSNVVRTGSNVVVSVPTKNKKRYQLEASGTPDGPTWTDVGAPIIGDGTVRTFTGPMSGTEHFYRVRCSDIDTDGDGVSDYAEALMGTDPTLATTATNASGGTATDGATLQSLLSVTAAATTPDAFEKNDTGTGTIVGRVTLTRTFGTMQLTIPFDKGGASDPTKGSATFTTDYTLTTGAGASAALIAAGSASRVITVTPVVDTNVEVPETAKFTFRLPGIPASATSPTAEVKIKDATVVAANRRLFVAYLGREAGVATTATGIATALVAGDNDSAVISLTFSNLSSLQNNAYVKFGGNDVQIIPNGQPSGFPWSIRGKLTLTTDQAMLNALGNGQLDVSVSSANFSAGEIRGPLTLATGSIADPPVPEAPPIYGSAEFPNVAAGGVTNNPTLDRDIARFLMQASYGPTPESIQEVRGLITANGNDAIAGYTAWIDRQLNLAQTPSPSLMKLVQAADTEEFIIRGNKPSSFGNDPQFGGNSSVFNTTSRTWVPSAQHQNNYPFHNNRRREWWTLVLNCQDQLRQRMALALHEIVVIGENDQSVLVYHYGTANYWDMLAANAFGRYRTILQNVTYSPMMGVYLSHLKNQRKTGSISPDENYAREIMQLFSIGLVLRHPNGSLKLDANTALPIPTYDQADITEMARVMTGLSFSRWHGSTGRGNEVDNTSFTQGNGNRFWQGSWTNPMKMFASTTATSNFHDFEDYTAYTGLALPVGVGSASKILFRGKVGQTVLPPRGSSQTAGTVANGNLDITNALDALANHPNTPVFISRLLIQRFTTSNPSAGYQYRITQKYQQTLGAADQLGQVIKAILLDYEARSLSLADNVATSGKPKEPLLHFTAMQRALKCYTGAPLANLNTMPVTFTTSDSWITTPYDTAEFNKFPTGTKRFRWPNTDATLTQSPQDAPSVFNWFLPDYVQPGPLAQAGLVAPELQVATESNVINVLNSHYNVLFTTVPPGGASPPVKPGRGLDNFFNLSAYQNSGGTQLSVPAYGVSAGYFSAAQFVEGTAGVPDDINNQLDNLLPDYGNLTTLYTNTYNQKLVELHAPNPVPAAPTNATKNQAHDTAALAVLDQCDLLLAAGFLKASGTPSRQYIIDALAGGIGSRTTHTDATNNGFLTNAQTRCKNIAYLVLTSPHAVILK